MKKTPFANALRKAEGTIAAATGGRRSWDSVALKETALAAMAGEKPSLGSCSPEEWDAMTTAFRVIADRTTAQNKGQASNA